MNSLECLHCGKQTSFELDCGGYDPCCIVCWTKYARPRGEKESWIDYTSRLPFKVEGDERVITKEEIEKHLEEAKENVEEREEEEEQCECLCCGWKTDANNSRMYFLPCGWFCKACMEDEHKHCSKCFPDDEEEDEE